MKFLIDECLHTSLVGVAKAHGHDANHVNWLGLSGTADRKSMPRIVREDWTFVTNNAADFRHLHALKAIHAGLIILVPQVVPARQRQLFDRLLAMILDDEDLVNEVVEIEVESGQIVFRRYQLAANGDAI